MRGCLQEGGAGFDDVGEEFTFDVFRLYTHDICLLMTKRWWVCFEIEVEDIAQKIEADYTLSDTSALPLQVILSIPVQNLSISPQLVL